MYNDNKYFYYKRRCIMKCLFLLYKMMYNDNKYFHYTRRCIMTTNISLYKKMYNDNKHFFIQEDVYEMFVSVIQEDV